MKKFRPNTSFRDLLITGWLIIFGVTVGVVAFHPAYESQGMAGVLRLSGLAAIGTLGGILLTRFVDMLGVSSPRTRKYAIVLSLLSWAALIPLMYLTFAMPWGVLIVLTLLYVRWKWAFTTVSS